jgi:hypothetical protein
MGQFARDIVDAMAQSERAARLIDQLERANERDEYEAQVRRRERMVAAQTIADSAFEPHGFRAPAPRAGETLVQYRRRLMMIGQDKLAPGDERRRVRVDDCAADAINVLFDPWMRGVKAAGHDPDLVPAGEIYSNERVDSSGHRITEFRGRESFVKQMGSENRRVTAFANRAANMPMIKVSDLG